MKFDKEHSHTHKVSTDYSDEMIRMKLITGLTDLDILHDVLAAEKKSLSDTIVFVEGKGGKKSQQSVWWELYK
jgi:hypothetical protein